MNLLKKAKIKKFFAMTLKEIKNKPVYQLLKCNEFLLSFKPKQKLIKSVINEQFGEK